MQKSGKIFYMVAVVSLLLASCSTMGGGGVSNSSSSGQSGMQVAGEKTIVVDWAGRTLGSDATPAWLGPAIASGNFTKYQDEFNVSGNFRTSEGRGTDVRAATLRADMNYARKIVKELNQHIENYAAEKTRSGGESDPTMSAIEEVTKTKSKVDITGHEKKTEFWQCLESEDSSGRKTKQYVVYQVYLISDAVWVQTTQKYLKEVIGDLPSNLKPEQKEVASLVQEMLADERHPVVLSQKQAEQKLEAEKRMVDVQVALAPAQQEAAAKAELAKLNQEALTERSRITSENRIAMTQAMAEGRVQEAAYLSGDPALQSAAATTAADKDLVEAMAIAASILF
jgi:hypothetical protein